MSIKRWIRPEPFEADGLAERTGLSPLLCRILAQRGFKTPEQIGELLRPDATLSDPYALADLDKAVERIRRALADGERIAVFGDYDCDGITATALMVSYLQAVGADVIHYVPDRETEGYGMNMAAVELLAKEGVGLIVTVDNGISAHQEVKRAAELGIDVVITDHHVSRDTLPEAVAVVNPHRRDDESGLKELAGVGVAFKLVCALEEDPEGTEMLEYYADLVAVGTVADVVPLTGENRRMVRQGLEQLAQTERAGLAALLAVCGLEGKPITADTIAYTLAPRLNATGRMGTADDAIELLLTDDVGYASQLAGQIDEQNLRRRSIEEEILAQIDGMLARDPALLRGRLLLVAGEDWHGGVAGIVASKLLERTGKPTIVFSREGELVRGSGRSLPGFSMVEAISACSQHLTRYGGHAQAAGMTLPGDKLGEFMSALEAYAKEHHPRMPQPSLEIDAVLEPGELTVDAIGALSLLEPFGAGNRSPLFLLENQTISGIYPTSDGKHLRIGLTNGVQSFTAVYFRMSEREFPYIPGDTVDLAASVGLNTWNGRSQISVVVRDMQPSGAPQEEILQGRERYACHLRAEYGEVCSQSELLPDREDVAVVYRFLRASGGFAYGADELYCRIAARGISYARLLVSLDVLEELGLVSRTDASGRAGYYCRPNPPKVDLEGSAILARLKV